MNICEIGLGLHVLIFDWTAGRIHPSSTWKKMIPCIKPSRVPRIPPRRRSRAGTVPTCNRSTLRRSNSGVRASPGGVAFSAECQHGAGIARGLIIRRDESRFRGRLSRASRELRPALGRDRLGAPRLPLIAIEFEREAIGAGRKAELSHRGGWCTPHNASINLIKVERTMWNVHSVEIYDAHNMCMCSF